MLNSTQVLIGYIIILCVVALAIVGLCWVVINKSKEKDKDNCSSVVELDLNVEETDVRKKEKDAYASSVIRYSDNYVYPETEPAIDTKHKILVITKDRLRTNRWICPRCEVENDVMNKKCCVCSYHYIR